MVTNNCVNTYNHVIQRVSVNKTAVQNITTVIPADDTIPQKAEGDEVLTLAITPKKTTNILVIEFNTMFQIHNNGIACVFALFQDATANALSATWTCGANDLQTDSCYIKHVMVAGTTAATTFKIRAGKTGASAFQMTLNGEVTGGGRLFGGVADTWLTITEYNA